MADVAARSSGDAFEERATAPDPAAVEGTFEYIEAKIRRDAEGTTFGGDFEWLCQ